MTDTPRPSQVSLDQLIALCDEMRALARTGVPLERSMLHLAEDLPSELGKVAEQIGERGESFAIAADVMLWSGVAFAVVSLVLAFFTDFGRRSGQEALPRDDEER